LSDCLFWITKNYQDVKGTPLPARCHLVKEEVEILVVGGGPAGLLTASHLADRHHVALIERGPLGNTSKYWVTTARRLESHGLAACVLHNPRAMTASTFLGGFVRATGDFAVVDDQLLMKVLVERCRSKGVEFAEECSLLNLQWTGRQVEIHTTSKSYSARLIIDATGGQSPIAATFRLHRLYGFYSVYGAMLRKISLRTSDIVLAHVGRLGDPPPILEIIPCGEDAAYCSIFTYSKRLAPAANLEKLFKDHCSHNEFFVATGQTESESLKIGSIPIGRIRRRQLPGVVLVGEAALVQPPLLGTAFNEVLEYCDALCAHISAILQRKSGVPVTPNYRYPLLKRAQDYIQLQIMRNLLNTNVEGFDSLVRFMGKLPSETVYAFCSNELNWRQLLYTVARLPLYLTRQAT
jgi:2-polyprenyl-6-methoxyphenol hydroxylase-like FAD-dependent oxidoreductase